MFPAAVTAIGEKRPGFGSAGTKENNDVNMFELTLKCGTIYHYDSTHSSTLLLAFC